MMVSEQQEKQRYGRDKNTTINRARIEGGEYRKKFNNISSNDKLNRLVYQYAKKMLKHRSGTSLEDMYWIDIDSLEIVASETDQLKESEVCYSKATRKAIKKHKNLLVMHTHPNSMPPSIGDFNSALQHRYRICIVCCHDGTIYMYNSYRHIFEIHYKLIYTKYKKMIFDEKEAMLATLREFQNNGSISFKEVCQNEIL